MGYRLHCVILITPLVCEASSQCFYSCPMFRPHTFMLPQPNPCVPMLLELLCGCSNAQNQMCEVVAWSDFGEALWPIGGAHECEYRGKPFASGTLRSGRNSLVYSANEENAS